MLKGYGLFLLNWCYYLIWQLLHLWGGSFVATFRNLLLLVVGLPLLLLLLHVHWLFLLLDEWLFPHYRQVAAVSPVLILGVPRSGTTFLQRTLCRDPQFTTTSLEECLLTPSICQRKIAAALRAWVAPLQAYRPGKAKRLFARLDTIHQLGMQEAEEDFLLLLPILSCFIQMVVFPQDSRTWRLAYVDQQLSGWQRSALQEFYLRMVQRHLYYHGSDKIYLSKNPSFTSMIGSLRKCFADATIVACVRSPEEALASQVSSLVPAFELLAHDINAAETQNNIQRMLAHYYREIEHWSLQPGVLCVLEHSELKHRLAECLQNLYRKAGLSMPADVAAVYSAIAEQNKRFESAHHYTTANSSAGTCDELKNVWPLSGNSRLVS